MNSSHSRQQLPAAQVLITGGSGFLGNAVIKLLTAKGLSLRIMSRKGQRLSSQKQQTAKNISWLKGDVANQSDLLYAAKGVDIIIHMAAAMQGEWSIHQATTIAGTQNVLHVCQQFKIKQLVYISTLNVYHAAEYAHTQNVDESFPYEPHPEKRGYYSAAKQFAERLIVAYAEQHPDSIITLLRPGLIYGPGLDPLLNDLGIQLGKRFIVCLGVGRRKLPLVYVTDVANAIFQALQISKTGLHRYNLVDNTYPTQTEYLSQYKQLSGQSIWLIPLPFWLIQQGIACIDFVFGTILGKPKHLGYRLSAIKNTPIFSIEKAEKELHWKPDTSVKSALTTMLLSQKM